MCQKIDANELHGGRRDATVSGRPYAALKFECVPSGSRDHFVHGFETSGESDPRYAQDHRPNQEAKEHHTQ